ncbi:exonuclease domain-containing protein [Kitasatospora cineracea]|uniref:exonuclease domain-containing protein n=1 Tax=Kitasatospora cineracea TaxID=88074 RepID=UPI0036A094E6
MSWHLGKLAAVDFETTGQNPLQVRIVSASVIVVRAQRGTVAADDGARWVTMERSGWLVGDVEIPAEAVAIHGITPERAAAEGRPAQRVVGEIGATLARIVEQHIPIAIMNAPYDLTVLDRELWRHGWRSLALWAGREPLVLDPMVLDRHVDQTRTGPRNLGALCAHYGVPHTAPHQAAADALAAARVVDAIARRYPEIADMPLDELHQRQGIWARRQASERARRYEAEGRVERVNGQWPLIPRPRNGGPK